MYLECRMLNFYYQPQNHYDKNYYLEMHLNVGWNSTSIWDSIRLKTCSYLVHKLFTTQYASEIIIEKNCS